MSIKSKIRQISLSLGFYRLLRELNEFVYHRKFNAEELRFYSGIFSENDLVFDVGANRGQSCKLFLKLGARVISYEPQKDLHQEIKQRCARYPNKIIKSCALGREVEERDLILKAYDQVASFDPNWEGEAIGSTLVSVSTLQEEIGIHGLPKYCKIDVEGWEKEVISGLKSVIPILSFEFHKSEDNVALAKDCLQLLMAINPAYLVNIKEAGKNCFTLNEDVPISEFMNIFPSKIRYVSEEGYGEIFCSTQSLAS